MGTLLEIIRENSCLGGLVHTLDHCLKSELKDCQSVLDLGCGPKSPIRDCGPFLYSVGVEAYGPYLEQSKRLGIHTEYIQKTLDAVEFPDKHFDAVVLTEVLEHMPKEEGLALLEKTRHWAKKKIIVSTPNGFFPMGEVDGNHFQRHLSGWEVDELRQLGFEVRGLSGAKFLYRKENAVHSLVHEEGGLYANMRFKPKFFFYLLNGFFQGIVYFIPKRAFGLFGVLYV